MQLVYVIRNYTNQTSKTPTMTTVWDCRVSSDHERLTHDLIIVRLRKALYNWIAFENKSNEHS
jgi:hypothetical protein